MLFLKWLSLTYISNQLIAQDRNNVNDPQKKQRLVTVSKNILLEGLNRFHSANLTLSSDVDQDT